MCLTILHNSAYVRLALPNLAEQPFIYQKIIQCMNHQTRYSLKASILEYKNSQTLDSEKLDVSVTELQNMPDVVELTRIMFGAIAIENARKMTLQERHAFFGVTNDLILLTQKLG